MNGILAIVGIAVAIGIIVGVMVVQKRAKSSSIFKYLDNVRKVGYGLLAAAVLYLGSQSIMMVDAGEIAVQVQFGAVLPNTISEGVHPKSPFVNIVTYNTRLQEFTMAGNTADGIDARTQDNSHVAIDATVNWAIDGQKAFDIYRTIARNNADLINIVIRPTIRNALYEVAARYPLEKIMTDRENYGKQVQTKITDQFLSKGLLVDKVLIRSISPPTEVDTAIKQKLQQQQALEAKTYELQTAQKNAEIKIAEAHGVAQAQAVIQNTLTPLYVQYEAIKSYEKLASSPNSTFVLVPTSPNGAGMPIILDARK